MAERVVVFERDALRRREGARRRSTVYQAHPQAAEYAIRGGAAMATQPCRNRESLVIPAP